MVNAYKTENKVDVPYKIVERRDGDIDACYSDPSLAKKLLNWEAELDLKSMVKSSYKFIKENNDK